jgi:Co/Zn/Cd efflux system component
MNELINEESWQLTQQTFNVLREKMPLHAPEIAHWVECMISGYDSAHHMSIKSTLAPKLI